MTGGKTRRRSLIDTVGDAEKLIKKDVKSKYRRRSANEETSAKRRSLVEILAEAEGILPAPELQFYDAEEEEPESEAYRGDGDKKKKRRSIIEVLQDEGNNFLQKDKEGKRKRKSLVEELAIEADMLPDDHLPITTGLEQSFSGTFKNPEDRLHYTLSGETPLMSDPNNILKYSSKSLMRGYAMQDGLSKGVRAILRVAVNDDLRSLWKRELETILQEDTDLAKEELVQRMEAGVKLNHLRKVGATEHELEAAGVAENLINKKKYDEEVRYEKEVMSLIQEQQTLTRGYLGHLSQALEELDGLSSGLSTFLQNTDVFQKSTLSLLSSVGEASKLTREKQLILNERKNDKETQIAAAKSNPVMGSSPQVLDRSMSRQQSFSVTPGHRPSFVAGINQGRRDSRHGSFSVARRDSLISERRGSRASMDVPYMGTPMDDGLSEEAQLGQILLKAGVTMFKFSEKHPGRNPAEYTFTYEDDLLKWNCGKRGKSPVVVTSASVGLPLWFPQAEALKHPWIKKLFSNIDHLLKHAIKVTATNLKSQDKWDMLLIADNSEVAHRVLSALEILDDSIKAPIEDETFNKQADPFMRTRSRAKTLTHQLSTQGTNGYAPVRAGSITEAKVQKGKGAYTAERKRIEKSKTDFDFIMSIIQHSPLFRNTTEEVLEDLTQIMRKITITDGMVIANQGTYASNFYIIQEGKLEGYQEEINEDGSVDSQLKQTFGPKDTFGDTSLIFKCPYLYSITACTDSVLWALDQETFSRITSENTALRKIIDTIVEVSIFNVLDDAMFSEIVLKFEPMYFQPHEVITDIDSDPNFFYVLQEGEVVISQQWYSSTSKGINERVNRSLTLPGKFFGDLELCFDQKMNQKYEAGPKGCHLLLLDLAHFKPLVQSLKEASLAHLKTSVLGSIPIFAPLNEREIINCSMKFSKETFNAGATIIKKGEKGDKFYFLMKGECIVLDVKGNNELQVVNRILGHGSFGELALLSDTPRNAFVVAESDVTLFSLKRKEFQALVNVAKKNRSKETMQEILKQIDLLNALSDNDYVVLADALIPEKINEGKKLVTNGDMNDKLYIVSQGELMLTREVDGGKSLERVRLLPGNYFGERALMTSENCFYDVTASRLSEVMALTRHVFEQYCGSLADLLQSVLKKTEEETKLQRLNTSDFEDRGIIGRGAFGTVRLVKDRIYGKWYAMKCLVKHNIVKKNHQRHLKQEIQILQNLDHEMIIRLTKKWQDDRYIYILTELCSGGELFSEMKRLRGFDESRCKFYAACVVSMLSHLRQKEIVYRDLKPENILIDNDGYLKLIDFGFAKNLPNGKKAKSLCGTPDYVAPEVLLNEGYGPSVDTWALGILVYEMITNETPFRTSPNDNAKVVLKNILQKKLSFNKHKFAKVSKECISFIQGCLKKEQLLRLGSKDADELKNHPWFSDYGKHGWNALERKLIRPPFVPSDTNPENIRTKAPKPEEKEQKPVVQDYELDAFFAHFEGVDLL